MKKDIQNFLYSKKALFKSFGCKEDYHIRLVTEKRWVLKSDEDVTILSTFENEKREDFVVTNTNGKPSIYKKNGFTMVICIDCIKLAFILDDGKRI